MTESPFVKATQDTLGKIIRKPPLTEKLLKKPPFRFLHDIITEVIRTTGFFKGLYNETELDSKNVTAREDKIAFLQKAIDCASLAYGTQLSAKPAKIVAGHEPEKTNEFLQCVGKCIKKNISSNDAVEKIKSGKRSKPPSGSKKAEGKENREQHDESKRERKRDRDRHEKDKDRDRSRDGDRKHRSSSGKGRHGDKSSERGAGEGSEEKTREEKKHERRDKQSSKTGEASKSSKKKDGKSSSFKDDVNRRNSLSKKSSENINKTEKENLKEKRRKSSTSEIQRIRPSMSRIRPGHSEDERREVNEMRKISRREEAESRSHSGRIRRHREREEDNKEDREDEEQDSKQEESSPTDEKGTPTSRPPRPASAKGHRRRPMAEKSGDREPQHDESEERPTKPTQEGSRGKPARPPSARPAAPRVRQRKNPSEEEIARIESAGRSRTAHIITDDAEKDDLSSDEDDDKQFLVQEEGLQPPDMEKLSPLPNGDVNPVNGEDLNQDEHGILVRKILETKKEIETSAAKGHKGKKHTEIDRAPVNEAQRRKERELVMKSIDSLRASVQKLCRSAAPLGKMIDYIQEDMDAMNNEIAQWRKENQEHAAKLEHEESVTQKTIEPLKAELAELDRAVVAQMDMIAAAKCNVLKNQEKIDKMITGVTTRS